MPSTTLYTPAWYKRTEVSVSYLKTYVSMRSGVPIAKIISSRGTANRGPQCLSPTSDISGECSIDWVGILELVSVFVADKDENDGKYAEEEVSVESNCGLSGDISEGVLDEPLLVTSTRIASGLS